MKGSRAYLAVVYAIAGATASGACASSEGSENTSVDGGIGSTKDSGTVTVGSDGAAAEVFIAFGREFENFRTWEKFPLAEDKNGSIVHLAGKRTEYINKRPPPGSKSFPVGTIIVKEMDGDLETRQIFAMVKRAPDFNPSGAVGWEWFELTNKADGIGVNIVWRGVGPPDGERYGGAPTGACNVCHGGSKRFDYANSPGMHTLITPP